MTKLWTTLPYLVAHEYVFQEGVEAVVILAQGESSRQIVPNLRVISLIFICYLLPPRARSTRRNGSARGLQMVVI